MFPSRRWVVAGTVVVMDKPTMQPTILPAVVAVLQMFAPYSMPIRLTMLRWLLELSLPVAVVEQQATQTAQAVMAVELQVPQVEARTHQELAEANQQAAHQMVHLAKVQMRKTTGPHGTVAVAVATMAVARQARMAQVVAVLLSLVE